MKTVKLLALALTLVASYFVLQSFMPKQNDPEEVNIWKFDGTDQSELDDASNYHMSTSEELECPTTGNIPCEYQSTASDENEFQDYLDSLGSTTNIDGAAVTRKNP